MALFRRVANLFRRSKVDHDINAELQAHIAMRMDANIATGMSPEDARRDALLRFGNPTMTRERVAASDATLSLAGLGRDLRYAGRQLRRSPGFALTAILTLALGIGANVVVFGVLNAMILRPLNVAGADRLFELAGQRHGDDNQCYPDYIDFKTRNSTFTDMATYRLGYVGLSSGGSAEKSWEYEVSGNYFDMLGVQPQLGRFFHASDERGPNSAPYIVLSDVTWRTRFNADPRVVGTIVDLNKHPFTIIGVDPKSFNGTEIFFWPEFWVPMINEEQIEGYNFLTKRGSHGLFVIGSLKPGVTPRQAEENLDAVAHQMTREHPTEDDGLSVRLVKPGLLGDTLGEPAQPFLAAIMSLALLVLLAACVNLAGIFAARAADRSKELAIRLSIGSTRWRILRQLLTEAVVVSLAGGALGTLIATAMLKFLSHWQPISEYPIHVTVVADSRTYLIALLLSFAAGVLPGLLPARQVWRTDATDAMKSGTTSARIMRRLTLRDLLLGIQIALCALLLTASLVALRGMDRSLHAPLGFAPQGTMVADTDMHMAGYSDDSAFPVQRRIIEQALQLPGVQAAGTIDSLPLGGGGSNWSVYREGTTDLRSSNSVMTPHSYGISPGYLKAARSTLLAGRDFTWDDGPKTPSVAIVNEFFARKMFGDNQSAIGRHFLGGDKSAYQIVGIIENGKYEMLTEDQSPAMFFPLAQAHEANTLLIVRSELPPAETASALNRMLTGIDASLPFGLRTWPDRLSLALFPPRIATAALGVMGILAAMLAVTGIFGMATYTVSKRMRELGIRVALGAHRAQLMRAALGRPLLVLLSGSLAGLVLGVLASRLLAGLVYEATPRDPLVLIGAVAAMTLIGLVATWIPARRAMAINPAQLLRQE
ncbi:MAG TPA: ABC transporter permease [Terracidiphilus sp.]|nr:ABC transporter permease [Terracidiphilus sp.]